MSDVSKIEWTEATWNPIVGCSKISAGCLNCYAERMARRLSKNSKTPQYAGLIDCGGRWTGETRLVESALDQPFRWRKPRRIFVCSMSDLFHPETQDEWIDQVFAVMTFCPQHTFQILTKRADRMLEYFERGQALGPDVNYVLHAMKFVCPLPNVHVGVTVENQDAADSRIPLLLQTPAAVRYVSVEPMIGPVDLDEYIKGTRWFASEWPMERWLDWVVAGGESGPNARPMNPDWVRALRDQCVEAGVPFFFKQWGGANKRKAGRWLDGRTWDEMPIEE